MFVTPHELLRQQLAEQGVDLGPSYAERAGIYDRNEVWAGYREALAAEWVPYLRGERSREEALAALVKILAPPQVRPQHLIESTIDRVLDSFGAEHPLRLNQPLLADL